MRKQEVAPDVIAEAVALRQVGYTTLAISQRLGVSVRTLQRHFATMKAKKGTLKEETLERARSELLDHVTNDLSIKEEAARLIADDLAHSRHLREIMLAASDQMQAASLRDVVQVMRAAAAYSTALKNTSDVVRHGLRLERLQKTDIDDLPELVVCELSADEVATLRDAHQTPDDLLSNDKPGPETEVDDFIEEN